MTILSLIALSFAAWLAFKLYQSIADKRPQGFKDNASTAWAGLGIVAIVIVALSRLIGAVL